MNTSRVQLRSSITVGGKHIFVRLPAFLSEPGSARYSSAPSITTVEFYLYPTVGTVLIHSVKPELTEYRTLSNTVDVQTELYLAFMVSIRRIVTYNIFINKQLQHINGYK